MNEAMEYQHWHVEIDDDRILWLGLDRKGESVNTISRAVLDELSDILEGIEDTNKVSGIIIYSRKSKGFIAGADLKEISSLQTVDEVREVIEKGQRVYQKLADVSLPTVAMIDGFCLGGGLELSLACRYRVAEDGEKTKIAAPEIKLGIYPGWGGSVRLPRLLGALKAMDLILTGRAVSAKSAKMMGLIDAAVPRRQLKRAALYYIKHRPTPYKATPLEKLTNMPGVRKLIAKLLTKQVAKKAQQQHYPAPYAAIDTWARVGVDSDKAFVEEANSVVHLFQTDTAKNLGRVFFLQEQLKELGKTPNIDFQHLHVIGAGIMGGDIAAWCALQGFTVTLQDKEAKFITPAIKRAYKLFEKKLKKPRLIQAAMDRLIPDPNGRGIANADIIIEAIVERLDAKQSLFKELESKARKDAVLATNTSTIPLDEINQVLLNPERLVGIHFFNPVSMLPLVEVIKGTKTDNTIFQKAMAFVHRIERYPLPVKSSPGFLVNRILLPYMMEALYLYESGVPAPAIDRAAVDFGMPMGPIELADAVGLDICLSAAEKLSETYGGVVPEQLKDKVAAGELGKKSGKGFYTYKNGQAVKSGKQGENVDLAKVSQRLILSMLNTAVACWREGIVTNLDLIDAGMIFGTGFAPFRGGPMHYIHTVGKQELIEQLKSLQEQHGDRFKPDAGWETLP